MDDLSYTEEVLAAVRAAGGDPDAVDIDRVRLSALLGDDVDYCVEMELRCQMGEPR